MLNFNGTIIDSKTPIFTVENRNFRYGDGVFETIRVFDNHEMPFLELHKQRLLAAMTALAMNIPHTWKEDFMSHEIQKLLMNLPPTQNYRLRFAVFRVSGGLYTPISNDVEFCIEATPLTTHHFELNEIGLQCSIFDEIAISPSKISVFKTSNALPYIMAALYRQNQQTDDCFILNTSGRICETVSANIFGITLDNQLVTPPISEGCIDGIMRKAILKLAQKHQINYCEIPITLTDLQNFQEVFISNAIQGIRWVAYCKPLKKIYTNHLTKKLFQLFLDTKELRTDFKPCW
jgi:branched-chain amino acid aminotransferase